MSASSLLHSVLSQPVNPDLLHRSGDHGEGPRVTWLGVAGIAVEHAGEVLLLDPYVSRPGLRRSLTLPLRPDERAVRRYLPRADYIVCTHSHFDHILDVPMLARATGAQVVGSTSSCNHCRAAAVPDRQLLEVRAPQELTLGPFQLSLRPSAHVHTPAGRPPLVGRMGTDAAPPMRARQFLSDETFGTMVRCEGERPWSLFHLGSGAFLPETLLGHAGACDLLMVALIGRQQTPGFTARLLANLRPRAVIPIHFDNFFLPVEAGLRAMRLARLEAFLQEVREADTPCEAVVLDLMGTYRAG